MTDKETPEAGTRILEGAEIQSWKEAPHEGELEIRKQDEES